MNARDPLSFRFEVDRRVGGYCLRLVGEPEGGQEGRGVCLPLADDMGPTRAHHLADALNETLGLGEEAGSTA